MMFCHHGRRKSTSDGFTLLELMIASGVFAIILLICTTALLQIGKIYYRGITVAKTQESARSIMDTVSRQLQFNGGKLTANIDPAGGVSAYCIDNTKYSFKLNTQVMDVVAEPSYQGKHALVVEDNSTDCSAPTPLGIDGAAFTLAGNQRELLDQHMRLTEFSINPIGTSSMYEIKVRVVYGVNDDLEIDPLGNVLRCKSITFGSQFCAMAGLTTKIEQRIKQ